MSHGRSERERIPRPRTVAGRPPVSEPSRGTSDLAAHILHLQRTIGNRAVGNYLNTLTRLQGSRAPLPMVQRALHKPGARISFKGLDDADYSGLIAKIKTDSDTESDVVYEVDAAKDGAQRSYLVKNGRITTVDMPAAPELPDEITRILDMNVVTVTEEMVAAAAEKNLPFKASVGDIMVGSGIIVKRPAGLDKGSEVEQAHKRGFQQGAVRDLWLISQTESGKGLLTSINNAAKTTAERDRVVAELLSKDKEPSKQVKSKGGVATFIDFTNRSNAGERDQSEAAWDTTAHLPGKGSTASVGYNPSMAGLPLAEKADLSDEMISPALHAGWGRPKEKPSDVTLFHEMVHADDIMHGRLDTQEVTSGQFNASKVSEMHAVGLEEYRDTEFLAGRTDKPSIYSENTYRKERGVADRPWYKDEAETQPRVTPAPTGDEPAVAVPQPMSGTEKFFSRAATIKAHEKTIETAKETNKQIASAKSRKLLKQAVEQSNLEAIEDAGEPDVGAEPKKIFEEMLVLDT